MLVNSENKLNNEGISIMIFLDSDVVIDILRQFSPAMEWFDSLNDDEELVLSGFVVMELIQGCKN